jgi:hypothetical protein
LGCRSPSPLPLSPVRPARVQPCNKHALFFSSLGIPQSRVISSRCPLAIL